MTISQIKVQMGLLAAAMMELEKEVEKQEKLLKATIKKYEEMEKIVHQVRPTLKMETQEMVEQIAKKKRTTSKNS